MPEEAPLAGAMLTTVPGKLWPAKGLVFHPIFSLRMK